MYTKPFNLTPVFARLDEKVSVAQLLIAQMLASDKSEPPLNMLVLHGLSEGMYASGDLIAHAAGLWISKEVNYIAVVGGDGSPTGQNAPGVSWVGAPFLVSELERLTNKKNEIIVLDPITHTKEEAYAIIRMAQMRGFQRVGSVSVAYHGPRILHCLVAVMKELNYWVEWHMMLPPQTDWLTEMVAAQGQGTTNSVIATLDDAQKVQKYIDNRFGATYAEVLYYLCNRSRIVETQTWDFPGE